MTGNPRKFLADTNGAATDWIILSAGVALLGLVTVYEVFLGGAYDVVSRMNQSFAGDSKLVIATNEPSSASEGIRDDCRELTAFQAVQDCEEDTDSSPLVSQ